ncbi:GTPase IMAP family member 6-like isoform X1 [Sardina pilchardus]|uniref:GTPase IMAP family member 6-like isoform X1 n=1 Tax=Sardina pilchardus TaxID=27697 RepID=UPI002E0F6124
MKEEEVEPIPKEQQKDTDGEEDNNLPQSEMKEEEVEPIPKEQQKDTDGEEDKDVKSSQKCDNTEPSTHETVDSNQVPEGRSGIFWMRLVILAVLILLMYHHRSYQFSKPGATRPCLDPLSPEPQLSDSFRMPELKVMMLGRTGSGKSASGNTILGREAFKSETSAVPVTMYRECQSEVVEGRNITVIDTPEITLMNASGLSECPHVFLLVIPMGGVTFSNEVKWVQNSFGEEALKFTIVLFTRGDQLKRKSVEEFLQESSGLQTLVNNVGGRYHMFDNENAQGDQQVKELLGKIDLLLRQNVGYSYSHGLDEQLREKEWNRLTWQGMFIVMIFPCLFILTL